MGKGTAAAPSFRTIGQLAQRCGHYCWLENQLFALTGGAATAAATAPGPDPHSEVRLFLSESSAQHAALAAEWRARLPVRAGVDADALVVPPPGPAGDALALLAAAEDPLAVLGGLVQHIWPWLFGTYQDHLADAPAVSEAPVRAVLELACFWGGRRLSVGLALLQRAMGGAADVARVADLDARLQRLLGEESIFPAAQAS
jgi:hypothetical protein